MVAERGADPFEFMAGLITNPEVSWETRMRAAGELSGYLQPKIKQTDLTISGNPDAPLVVRMRRRGD